MSLQLERVDLQQLEIYQQHYKQQWPKYCAEFYCLDNFIGFFRVDPQMENVKAYALSEQRAKDAALFVIVDRYQLFIGCLDSGKELLREALHLLDWSSGLKCSSIPFRHIEALEQVVNAKQLRVQYRDLTDLYYMPQKEAAALEADIPAGYYTKSLSEQDAELINEEWPNRHEGSLYFIRRQIRLCVSIGLYAADTNELVAWCIRLQGGYLGALQVRATHMRRGFGSLVTKKISQRIAALGQDVMALVNPHNIASNAMFTKLGFQVIDQCLWLRTEPVAGEFMWPDGQ
ncbi:uncharacterized protein LOC115564723 [Drosophila navojoa]|nr:uncharacterized protein LOC115564723 [Drosophila navojoa]